MNKSQVLADIQAKIKTNGNQEITGDILQSVLTESVNLVPDLVSELTNDAKYQTEEEVDAKVNTKADIAQLNNLTNTVNTKADQNQIDGLTNKIDTKVDRELFNGLSEEVTANTEAITTLQTEMGNVNTQLENILYGSNE